MESRQFHCTPPGIRPSMHSSEEPAHRRASKRWCALELGGYTHKHLVPHTFDICIDESGDDGFSFSKPDCSHWFILAGVVVIRKSISELDELLRGIKRNIGWKDRKPLHFRDLRAPKRELAIERIADCGIRLFRGIAVLIHKPSLADPEIFQEKHRLYFYFTRFLLERSSWLCRDARIASKTEFGNGRARIVFSGRNDLPYPEMRDYLGKLRTESTSIAWDSLDTDSLITLTNGKHSGLQIADSGASAFYCANHHRTDLCSDRWVKGLKPIMYSNRGRHRGYGVKLFPSEAEKQIAQGALAPWAKTIYPQ